MNLVSICVPTYNGEKFIAEALESAINQTYINLEIIISDDASNDNTLTIVESFKSKTNIPIKIFNHEPNGIGANWNNCIKKAKGEYIKFLFQDDVLLPTCIKDMVDVIKYDQQIGLIASKREIIIEDSYLTEVTKIWIKKYSDLQSSLSLPTQNEKFILNASLFKSDDFYHNPRNIIGEPSVVLFRKDLVEKIGFFREDLKQILDFEFYYRILKKYYIVIIPKKTVKFRLHNNQATSLNRGKNSEDYIKYDEIIYKKFFWYVNWRNKKLLLKKHNSIVKYTHKLWKYIKKHFIG